MREKLEFEQNRKSLFFEIPCTLVSRPFDIFAFAGTTLCSLEIVRVNLVRQKRDKMVLCENNKCLSGSKCTPHRNGRENKTSERQGEFKLK